MNVLESSSIQVISTQNIHHSTAVAGTSTATDIPGVSTWPYTPQISRNIDPRTRDIATRSGPKSKQGRRQKKTKQVYTLKLLTCYIVQFVKK